MANARRKSDRPSFNRSPVSSVHLSIGNDLDVVLDDRKIKTDPIENKHRRTIIVTRENGSFGFTLQSYGLRRRYSDETELLSYVDYVEFGGPAQRAGMRAGDVILSVNGESMESADHVKLVNSIRNCPDALRMVVLFEDVCRKIELHLRYLKLKQVLAAKMYELRAVAYQEAKILEKVGAFGVGEEGISFEMSDISGSLGSAYFDCDSLDLAEQMLGTPSVFCSNRELRFSDGSPDVASLGSPLQPPHCSAMSRSPGAVSLGSPMILPHGAAPSPLLNSGCVVSPTGTHLSALPPPDDAFWSSSEFSYGSLPTRSRKRSFLSNRSYSSPKDAGTQSLAFRQRMDHVHVSSTLFEEGDESQEVRGTVEKKSEKKDLPAVGSKLSPVEIVSPSDPAPAKMLGKISASVPNLIKLKGIGSPFLPRRSKNSFMRSNSKAKDDLGDLHVERDPRVMTKQMREQISNYVMTEDLCRRPDDPQLLGLKQLCNDFRDSCFQQNLKQRRKSIEAKTKRAATVRPTVLDLKSGDARYQKPEFQVSKDSVGVEKELARPIPDGSQTLPRAAKKAIKRSETADARHPPVSKRWPNAVDEPQCSSYDKDVTLGTRKHQTAPVMESGIGLHESHSTCDVPDGSASSYSSSALRGSVPCLNADDEVTRL